MIYIGTFFLMIEARAQLDRHNLTHTPLNPLRRNIKEHKIITLKP